MIYFISDTHFFHNNVIKFDRRPFDNMDEMLEKMLEKWNNKVSDDDTVYVLGDYAWKLGKDNIEWLKQLKGCKHLIRGNHDKIKNVHIYNTLFESVKDYDDIVVELEDGEKKRVIVSHYYIPLYNSHYYGSVHLYGHSHLSEENITELCIQKSLREKGCKTAAYNVGCMQPYMHYEPQTLDWILEHGEFCFNNFFETEEDYAVEKEER